MGPDERRTQANCWALAAAIYALVLAPAAVGTPESGFPDAGFQLANLAHFPLSVEDSQLFRGQAGFSTYSYHPPSPLLNINTAEAALSPMERLWVQRHSHNYWALQNPQASNSWRKPGASTYPLAGPSNAAFQNTHLHFPTVSFAGIATYANALSAELGYPRPFSSLYQCWGQGYADDVNFQPPVNCFAAETDLWCAAQTGSIVDESFNLLSELSTASSSTQRSDKIALQAAAQDEDYTNRETPLSIGLKNYILRSGGGQLQLSPNDEFALAVTSGEPVPDAWPLHDQSAPSITSLLDAIDLQSLGTRPTQQDIDDWLLKYRAKCRQQGEHDLRCPACGGIQRRPAALRNHLYFRYRIKPYKCSKGCGYSFSTADNMQRHIDTCTGIPPLEASWVPSCRPSVRRKKGAVM